MKKIIYSLILLISLVVPQKMYAAWSNYTIVLDPGHGGDDPGAVYNGSSQDDHTEAWLVLQCAINVKDHLKKLGANVYMTRTSNDFSGEVGLSTRRAYCYTYDSDVFVSFHLNAANASAHGTETWYYYDGSYNLATYIQSGLINKFSSVDGTGDYEMIDRGIKNNGWTVITAGEYYPAVLTEGLFVDCYNDWQLIKDINSSGFNAWADGHLKGIYDYLNYYGYYSVTEPKYNGAGGSGVSQDPYISVSSDKVYLSCVAGETASAEVVIEGQQLNRWTTITLSSKCEGVFSVDKKGLNVSGDTHTFDPEKPKIKITFSPQKAGTYSGDNDKDGYEDYVITLESKGVNGNLVYQWITLSGVATEPPLSFNEGWVLSENKNNLTTNGWDASKVRNMDVKNGKIYAVYEHSKIKVIDAYTRKPFYDLSNEGVSGGILALCDVRVFDGKVVASNLGGIDAQGNTHDLRIYTWDNPNSSTEAPNVTVISYETLKQYNITRLGDYIGLGGDWNNTDGSRIIFAYNNLNQVEGVTGGTYIIEFPIKDNVIGTTPNKHIQVTDNNGANLYAGASIRVYPTSYGYMLDGSQCAPSKLDPNGKRLDYMDGYKTWGNVYRQFEHNEVTYGVTLDFNDKTFTSKDESGNPDQSDEDKAKNYTGGFMRLLKISDDSNSASYRQPINLAEYPKEHLANTKRNTNCTGNVVINTKDDGTVEAWVISTGQGIAFFTSSEAPVVATPSIEVNNSTVNLTANVGESDNETITVNGYNLINDITASISGENAGMFTLSTSSIDKADAEGAITIIYEPTANGNHSATLTLSTEGAEDVTVTLNGTAMSSSESLSYTLTKNWSHTTGHVEPSGAGYGWSTGFEGKIYFNDNKDENAPKLMYWDINGLHTVGTSATGSAITSDEAGNIIVSVGYSSSANKFKVLPKNSNTWQDLTITLPEGVEVAITKYIGKAIGDIMSENGGVMCIIPEKANKVAKVTISNGIFKSSKAIDVSSVITEADAETFAMPLTSDINSDVIAVRKRTNKHFYHNSNGTFKAYANNGITTTQGGTFFKMGGKQFAVEPIGESYGDGFQIVDIANNTVVATNNYTVKGVKSPSPNCITAEVLNNETVKLYQYVPGTIAAEFTFSPALTVGVEGIVESAVKMSVATDGQVIRVAGVEAVDVEVYSIAGALVGKSNGTNEVDLGGNAAGIYIVKVIDVEGSTHVAKISYRN